MFDVIGELRTVCREAREELDVGRSTIAAKVNRGDQTIGGFETGKRDVPLALLDRLVQAYAEETRRTPSDLWLDAFTRASKNKSTASELKAAGEALVESAGHAGKKAGAGGPSSRGSSRSRKTGPRKQAQK